MIDKSELTKHITVRASVEEYQVINELAKSMELSVSDLIRNALNKTYFGGN